MRGLCEPAKRELNDLQRTGISPTLDQIIWLNDLGRRIENLESRLITSKGEPVQAGSVWLWPFTVQGGRWYKKSLKWFDGDDETEMLSLAYALAHGRDPVAFDFIWEQDAAKKAVDAWASNLDITHGELSLYIVKLLPHDGDKPEVDDEEQEDTGDEWAEMIISLCKEVGQTPEFWESMVSRDYCLQVIRTLNAQARAEDAPPDPNNPFIIATIDLARAAMQIRKEWKEDGQRT